MLDNTTAVQEIGGRTFTPPSKLGLVHVFTSGPEKNLQGYGAGDHSHKWFNFYLSNKEGVLLL